MKRTRVVLEFHFPSAFTTDKVHQWRRHNNLVAVTMASGSREVKGVARVKQVKEQRRGWTQREWRLLVMGLITGAVLAIGIGALL